MNFFKCDNPHCKKEGDKPVMVINGVYGRYDLCRSCGSKIRHWLEKLTPLSINWDNAETDGGVDDHTSQWGGAGPDCPIVRREAAIF